MLATICNYLLTKLETEVLVKRVCLATAKHLAAKSTNKQDDELVKALDKALN
ncbi:hypothetical protein ACFOEE_08485 [Pseudoalteromonas fenneropenaei]|uniref:Uncharacterized protein n=1 Tax=Pseudoalteromonas fenneropenaei TaxID=1737459 RepID=A0ABV7CJ21_9GAMM